MAFELDTYYATVLNQCSHFLCQYRGSVIPAHMDKIELYYKIPIFQINNQQIEIVTIIKTLTQELNYKVIGVTQKDEEIEYNARTFVRNSRNFGVPQNRPRVYIMGFDREHWGDEVDNLPDVLPEQREEKIYNRKWN